jgi:shikimate dehydrogenase
VTAAPRRLLLLGHPVAHSLSPVFQNAALRALGSDLRYEALDVPPERFAETFRTLALDGAAGNVTVPYKAAAAEACNQIMPLARRVGAVNTFWTVGGRLVGDNTDVGGFHAAARALLGAEPRELRVALLGAGGAAAAVLAAVAEWPASTVAVWNRSPDRAVRLAAAFAGVATAAEFLATAVRGADLVVNATTVGMRDDDVPFHPAILARRAAVLDLVYRPGETAWVRLARARGLRAADGLTMLVEQGALAFERWLGVPPDRAAMWAALRRTAAGASR